MDRIDCLVIGAGVIGLACARALAQAGREVILLEAGDRIGSEISSRNSEVIHAGLYYPPHSFKARLCLQGRDMLYAYCESHNIVHRRLGKIVVASSADEETALARIAENATACGMADLCLLDRAALAAREPDLAGMAGLLSPATGILDSHGLMLAFQGEIEDRGGMIAFGTRFVRAEPRPDGFVVTAASGSEAITLRTDILINAAGLAAGAVAAGIDGLDAQHAPRLHYCKGSYFALSGQRAPFSHLIYPVPGRDGLGVHLTFGLDGLARFGPDTEWVDALDYTVDPDRAAPFYAAIRRYWPDLRTDALRPDYAGIRPKLLGPGEGPADFVIAGPETHGLAGLVNLLGIESPGLTACLAIAREVAARV